MFTFLFRLLCLVFLTMGSLYFLQYDLESPHPEFVITQETKEYIAITKTGNLNQLIFYPGAFVEAEVYGPLAGCLVENGINTYVAKMPIGIALLKPYIADQIISDFSGTFNKYAIGKHIIGGHSLGGVAAANYIKSHLSTGLIDYLILLGSMPAKKDTLNETDISVLSLIGELDALATPEKVMARSGLLNHNYTNFVLLSGANHGQFGWYKPQLFDKKATLSQQEQLQQVCDEIVKWLK